MEREPSRAKISSTFTNNAPTPSAHAPIQSSRAPWPQEGSEDAAARRSPAPQAHAPHAHAWSPSARGRRDLAARAGGGYGFQRGVSPGTRPASPLVDDGAAGCALGLGALGPHLRQHLVPAICCRTGRALRESCVLPPPGTFLVSDGGERCSLGRALASEGPSWNCAATRAGTGGAGLGLRRPLVASSGLAGSNLR